MATSWDRERLAVGWLFVMLLGSPGGALGQVRVGARAGAGVAYLSFPDEIQSLTFEPPIQGSISLEEGVRPVGSGGIFLLVPIGGGFALEPGMSVTMRGGTLKGSGALAVEGFPDVTVGVDAKETYKHTTVDFAFLARYSRPIERKALCFTIGPEFSYVIHSIWEWSYDASVGGFEPENATGQANAEDDTRSLGLGMLLGVGAEFPQKTYSILLELRFSLGLTNLYEAPAGVDEPEVRPRGVVASFGLLR